MSQAQAPAAMVAAALGQTWRAMSSAVRPTYRAVPVIISQRNCTFHYDEELALFLPHHRFQCGLGLVPGACHDEFVIFPGKKIQHDFLSIQPWIIPTGLLARRFAVWIPAPFVRG